MKNLPELDCRKGYPERPFVKVPATGHLKCCILSCVNYASKKQILNNLINFRIKDRSSQGLDLEVAQLGGVRDFSFSRSTAGGVGRPANWGRQGALWEIIKKKMT